MFEIMLYFGAYALAAILLLGLNAVFAFDERRRQSAAVRAVERKKRLRVWIIALALPFVPYAAVETQTALFGHGVTPAIRVTRMAEGEEDQVLFLRILWITPVSARVYAVFPNAAAGGAGGFTYTLRRKSGRWVCEANEEVVWSDSGNADGNVFPPYFTGDEHWRRSDGHQ